MKIKSKPRTLTTPADHNERWEAMKVILGPFAPLHCQIPEAMLQDLRDASEQSGAPLDQIVTGAIAKWINANLTEDETP